MKKYTVNDHLPFSSLNEDGIVVWKGASERAEPIHTHDFIEITYIFSGKAIHKINDASYTVGKGDLLFINYNDTHCFEAKDRFSYCNILLLPSFINEELIDSKNALDMLSISTFNSFYSDIGSIHPFLHFYKGETEELEHIIIRMVDEFDNRKPGYRSVLKSLTTILLIMIFRKMREVDNIDLIGKTNKLTPEIIDYINNNCFKKISANELAQKCFYNRAYFSRVFKDCFGMTLTTFIQKKRVSKAQQLLTETDMSVNEICSYVGYSDKTQFYKIFKKYSDNLSPNEYRKLFATSRIPKESDNSEQ